MIDLKGRRMYRENALFRAAVDRHIRLLRKSCADGHHVVPGCEIYHRSTDAELTFAEIDRTLEPSPEIQAFLRGLIAAAGGEA